MDHQPYELLKEKAVAAAVRIGSPAFYLHCKNELQASSALFDADPITARCLHFLDDESLHPAHGVYHCEKVAREAGAVLMGEWSSKSSSAEETDSLMRCAHIAGLFHDIKRSEPDHPLAGSLMAEQIMKDFDLDERHRRYITAAIRNHEAFRKVLASEDEQAKLVSDALYDADKFRWGPDNFTKTLWLIMESQRIPLEALFYNYEEKMEGIRSIKRTFRSETGKKYGPEFIDMGIEIGMEIYDEMRRMIG